MKKLILALFTMTSTVALVSACGNGGRAEDSDGDEGGAGGDDESGGKGGGRSGGGGGSTSKGGGSGGSSTSGGSGGSSTSGGSGGTSTSGGSGGTSTSGGSGGTRTGGMMGTLTGNPMPGPYEMPFDVFIDPGTFTMMMGVKTYDGGNTCCIASVDEGDWTQYEAVDFGDHCAYDKISVRYASPNDGGIVEVRANALNGPVIGTVNLTKTGEDFGTSGEATGALMPVSGTHAIFVRFLGVSFGIGNFSKFVFSASGTRMSCP